MTELTLSELTEAFAAILHATVKPSEGTQATPRRAALAWLEMTEGYHVDLAGLLTVFDGEGYDQMIACRDIPFTSLCEHHLMPFTGTASIVYLPCDKIVGLSKLPRIVRAFSRRLQNQERLTRDIADALDSHLDPLGVLIHIEAHHTCMSARGVSSQGAMVTSDVRGAMREQPQSRDEALRMIGK